MIKLTHRAIIFLSKYRIFHLHFSRSQFFLVSMIAYLIMNCCEIGLLLIENYANLQKLSIFKIQLDDSTVSPKSVYSVYSNGYVQEMSHKITILMNVNMYLIQLVGFKFLLYVVYVKWVVIHTPSVLVYQSLKEY